jgi:hypothetical protein
LSGARFAAATRDELWSRRRLIERRLAYGEALQQGDEIVARDTRDDALVAACDAALERLHAHLVDDARVRLVAEATLDGVTSTITYRLGALAVVSDPANASRDLALLREIAATRDGAIAVDALPLVWMHGSAAVLLHEAFGHALEHDAPPVAWPSWLAVDAPLAMRRATFKDVPLRRMTTLVARQNDAPYEMPPRRIEVLLAAGGSYDPLTDLVTVSVAAADFVDGEVRRAAAPFTIARSRADVAAALRGAHGAPLRYPGVVCSREGQELVVGSHAPLLVTEWL